MCRRCPPLSLHRVLTRWVRFPGLIQLVQDTPRASRRIKQELRPARMPSALAGLYGPRASRPGPAACLRTPLEGTLCGLVTIVDLRGSFRAPGAPLLEHCPHPSWPQLHRFGVGGMFPEWSPYLGDRAPFGQHVMSSLVGTALWCKDTPHAGTAETGIPWPGCSPCPTEVRRGPGTGREGPRLVCKHTASPQLRAAWSPRVRRKSPLSTAVAACLLDRV